MLLTETAILESLASYRIPEHMRPGVVAYLLDGYPPSHFLRAVLEGNLFDAYARADDENADAMPQWVRFIWNQAPAAAWGSPATIDAWMERRRAERETVQGESD